jgi:diaminopimelate epimerase
VPIPFIKIEGLGNDYVYVDKGGLARRTTSLASLARAISNRRRGVGSDGLIVVERLGAGSAFMRVFNSDGSEAKFCGNGLRGMALFMRSAYKCKGKKFDIFTRWSDYNIEVIKAQTGTAVIRADLGSPSFDCRELGIAGDLVNCIGIRIKVRGAWRALYCVAMPNPHAVILVDNFYFDWRAEGSLIEKNRLFKNGINVMFTKVDSNNRISVVPWERGSGATLACGSGAAAATVITGLLGLTRGDVRAVMPGGALVTRWDIEDNRIRQVGQSKIAFSGLYNP